MKITATAAKHVWLVLNTVLLFVGLCFGQPKETLSATSGPPTTNVLVSGNSFPASTAVDIYFDTTDMALAVTNSTGVFSGIAISVPASALPGTHFVTAVTRSSGVAAQKPFLVQTNWAQFRFTPRHKARNLYENVLSPATVGSIDVVWSFATGFQVSSSPAVANGVVYVGSADSNIYALNANTGVKLWSFTTRSLVQSSPAVANGVVYVGSDDFNVYALNASTGTKLWSFATGSGVFASAAVVNGVAFVGSEDRNVYALNASTGAKLWSFTTGNDVFSSPAVANGIVYVGSNDGNVYALDVRTGARLWSFTTPASFVFSSPAVANGLVYVGSEDGNVYALDASTGARLWSFTTGGLVNSSPAVANGIVYVGSNDHNLYAFDQTGGAQMRTTWPRPDPRTLRPNLNLKVSQPVATLS